MAKKVLIVDDSALIRKQLGTILDEDGYDIGYAKNGLEAVEFAMEVDFDVITMDINMPIMDGLSAVKAIMSKKPTPIIMVSSLTQEQADITFEALDIGAIDYVPKPGTITLDIEKTKAEILDKVKMASRVNKSRLHLRREANKKKQFESKIKKPSLSHSSHKMPQKLVLVGASTGGPGLIETIVTSVPADYPYPICIVQHMPESFTGGFAKRLDKHSSINVVESKNAEMIVPGKAIIGKGGWHMHFSKKASGALSVKQVPNSMKRFFIPSVDEMFFSISKVYDPKNILAVELTGIGDDGADGMLELRQKGAYTIAEDETTAIVYGMPKEAWERGGAMKKMPFPKIVKEILKFGEK